MDDLQETSTQLSLGQPATAMFDEQASNHCRLKEQCRQDSKDVPAVPVPQLALLETYLASRWQPTFADAEALQLSPIEDGPGEIAGGNGNLRGLFPIQDSQGQACRRFASPHRTGDKTTGAAMTKIGFHVDYDRPIGDVGERGEGFLRNVGCASTVKRDAGVYDCRINGQCGHPFPDLCHW